MHVIVFVLYEWYFVRKTCSFLGMNMNMNTNTRKEHALGQSVVVVVVKGMSGVFRPFSRKVWHFRTLHHHHHHHHGEKEHALRVTEMGERPWRPWDGDTRASSGSLRG